MKITMNKFYKVAGAVLILGLFITGTVAYASSFSSEANKWFARFCGNPSRTHSINAAVCDLRDRILALESKPSWDEERIANLEARVTALENPPPPPPSPACTAVLCENFNSYADGPIVNQGWTNRVNGLTYSVQGAVVQEGAKALQNISNSTDNVITKGGSAFADGRQSVWVRTQDRASWGNYNIGENVQFCLLKGSWDSPSRTCIAFMKDGNLAYLDPRPDSWIGFDSYSDNTWTLVEIEWRSSDRSARFRANNGEWTNWMPIYNSAAFTNFDTVGFDAFLLGSGGVYFDNLY